ncbi:MAG TPA: SDR family oxidoreductase [Tepidisphaeraceae bacterium]|nr:SDR family oxidoreductase [Tepidisphaeraceae bacterium]
MPPTVLITGASSGIGLACATHLAARGWRVYAGVRDVAAFRHVSDALRPLRLDVTDAASIAAALVTIRAESPALTALVNNAGIAVSGPLECVTADELRQQFDVNVLGLAAVTRATLPLLRAHATAATSPTTIVNVSSVSGLLAFPFLGAYAASKFAVEAMSDALRIELSPWRIRVALVEPGPVATPIWAKAKSAGEGQAARWGPEACALYPRYFTMMPAQLAESERHAVPVEMVARTVERAVTAPRIKARYPLGPGSHIARLRKFVPDRWWDWLVRREVKK